MKKALKSISFIVVISMTLTLLGMNLSRGEEASKVSIDNLVISTNLNSYTESGVEMIGADELAKSLGAEFIFDKDKLKGTIKSSNNEIIFRLDNQLALVNGKYMNTVVGMKIKGLRIVIPAEFTAKILGAYTYFDLSKNELMIFNVENSEIAYTVRSGDSLWTISKLFGTTISQLKLENSLNTDTINIGQKLKITVRVNENLFTAQIVSNANLRSGASFDSSVLTVLPALSEVQIIGKNGDWYEVNTTKYHGYVYKTLINISQDYVDNTVNSNKFEQNISIDTSMDSINYVNYTIAKGDNVWNLAEKFGIPDYELSKVNGFSSSTVLRVGQIIKIPVHVIPMKQVADNKSPELLDWFKEAQYVFPILKVGKLTDIKTGKSFNIERTMGANHSDTETLTAQDTQMMKSIFGGVWSWERRIFILEVDNRKIAVSISGMPHAGVDGVPFNQNVDNRSGGYGYGPNYDRISGNGMDGHFDLYMLNCLRHVDNKIDPVHQLNVLLAAGLK